MIALSIDSVEDHNNWSKVLLLRLLFSLYSVSKVKDNWTNEASGKWLEGHSGRLSEGQITVAQHCCFTSFALLTI